VKETCDAIVTSEVAIKLDDPGSFSIPCVVGTQKVDRALCDLGASVSVIPLAIAKRLDVKNLTRASFTIKLADGTSKAPIGLLKDMMVKVGNLTIPADFVVMDIPMGKRSHIILGRPFLATGGVKVDVRAGRLSFEVGKDKVYFKLPGAPKGPAIERLFSLESVGHDECQDNHDERVDEEETGFGKWRIQRIRSNATREEKEIVPMSLHQAPPPPGQPRLKFLKLKELKKEE